MAVTGRRLDEIVRSLGVDRVDLLKMNIEGAELAVLESSRDVLATVDNLVVSCHDFLADGPGPDWRRTFGRVTDLLTSAGYAVKTRPSDSRAVDPVLRLRLARRSQLMLLDATSDRSDETGDDVGGVRSEGGRRRRPGPGRAS